MARVLGLPIAARGTIASGGRRVSRFSRMVLPRMLGVLAFDRARSLYTSPLTVHRVLPSAPETDSAPGSSTRFRGSIPGLRVPLSTLRSRPRGR